MADVVQFRMERMADELDDLERRGLFTRPEIAEIVRRRRDFEYRLKRPSPLKQDFLAYIDYERQLDALRALRKRKIIGNMKDLEPNGAADEGEKQQKRKKAKKWKKSVSDYAGVRRILDIYRLATMRFRGDLQLWFRYLEFCRERNDGRMKKVLADAIRFHPKVPGLWIYAAAWEFDQDLNVAAARALMQSGIRACPESEDLWIEYLRMELTYLNKLKARKVALGEDVATTGRDSEEAKQWEKDNEDLYMSLNEERENAERPDRQEGALEKTENLFWKQGSIFLQTIYHGAVEAMPTSMSLRKRFMDILDSVDLAHSDKLKEEIMEDLKKNFSKDELYWDWLARLQMSGIKKGSNMTKTEALAVLHKVAEVYEDALNIIPTIKMFSLYAKFWLDMIVPDGDNYNSVVNDFGVDAGELSSSLLKVYKKAELNGCLTEDLASQYVSFWLQTGKLDEARDLAEKLCNGKLSNAADLWTLRVTIEIKRLATQSPSMSQADINYVFKLFENAVTKVSVSEAEGLWLMGLKFFSSNGQHFEKVVKGLMTALARAGRNYSGCAISSAVVNSVFQRSGLQRAREMYMRFLSLPHPSLGLFRYCIELESNLACVGRSDCIKNVRRLYESALSLYDQNRELWKDYYKMETKVGTSETANAIYWRARKTLKDTTGLLVAEDL